MSTPQGRRQVDVRVKAHLSQSGHVEQRLSSRWESWRCGCRIVHRSVHLEQLVDFVLVYMLFEVLRKPFIYIIPSPFLGEMTYPESVR
jgi:hypothetical protein